MILRTYCYGLGRTQEKGCFDYHEVKATVVQTTCAESHLPLPFFKKIVWQGALFLTTI
jgi:hypothetical protein